MDISLSVVAKPKPAASETMRRLKQREPPLQPSGLSSPALSFIAQPFHKMPDTH
jgi:hypothetical protein